MFKRALLKAVSPPPPRTPGRTRLREAIAARDSAQRALKEAQDTTQRVRAAIDAAEPAEARAVQAAKAAEDASQAWALAGAKGDTPPGDRALLERASDAEREAYAARRIAAGATAALPAMLHAEKDASNVLERAREQIELAVLDVILTETEPHFAAALAARTAYLQALSQVLPLRALMGVPWGPGHTWRAFSGVRDQVARRFDALAIPAIESDPGQLQHLLTENAELRAECDAWASYGTRLSNDADAAFDE
jgi:hypothetical protein